MEKDVIDRLARIETKLDVIAPHFTPDGTIQKLVRMKLEWNVLKGFFALGWAWILAKVSGGK